MIDHDNEFSVLETTEEISEQNDKNNQDQQYLINNYYSKEYYLLFCEKDSLNDLKSKAFKGELRSCRFRSVCWRLFLQCLPENKEERITKLRESRNHYESIKAKYSIDPRDLVRIDNCVDNPLSQDETSKWHKYFSDSELKSKICQDVLRTFPEIDFFQSLEIQTLLINILFNYSKEHPKIEYKQGMHEIAAPLLFVIHSDQQAFVHAQELGLIENEITELLDPNFVEHDTYHTFCHVMDIVESWYYNDLIQQKPINPEPFSIPNEESPNSILGVKLKMITEQILRRYDCDLYNHLINLEITPQIFGIRWMRLLFGREFSMQDLLVIWDAIFADGISFGLCDYIFASMLIVIRKFLLRSDYSECLNYLMRYPEVSDVQYIIDLALHLRDPVNYVEPTGYTPHVLPFTPPLNNNLRKISQNTLPSPESNGVAKRPNDLPIKSISLFSPTNQKRNQSKEMTNIASINTEVTTQDELNLLREKVDYCWQLMSEQIEILQQCLIEESHLELDDKIMVSVAELKKVRDLLKGTLKFTIDKKNS